MTDNQKTQETHSVHLIVKVTSSLIWAKMLCVHVATYTQMTYYYPYVKMYYCPHFLVAIDL